MGGEEGEWLCYNSVYDGVNKRSQCRVDVN